MFRPICTASLRSSSAEAARRFLDEHPCARIDRPGDGRPRQGAARRPRGGGARPQSPCAAAGGECPEDPRRAYRDLLFTTPGVEQHLSGVILYDETIRQKGKDGTPFPQLLSKKG